MGIQELLDQVSEEILANPGPFPSLFTLRAIPGPPLNPGEARVCVWQAMMQTSNRTVTKSGVVVQEVLEELLSQTHSPSE